MGACGAAPRLGLLADVCVARIDRQPRHTHTPAPAAARLLAPGDGQPAGQGAFSLFGKTGRSPRVYCCAGRDAVLKAIQVSVGSCCMDLLVMG